MNHNLFSVTGLRNKGRNFTSLSGILSYRRYCKGGEVDQQSETNSVHSQPQNKRRKFQTPLCLNSDCANNIYNCLRNDEITTIGIYGTGGVGKTTLGKKIQSRLLNHDVSCANNHVIAWVSVGMEFTTYLLQKKIAEAFGLDLEFDKDETRRAGMLYAFLSRAYKCILFLDDLWEDFRREDVGIPKQCKLILISRSLDVCRILRCEKIIKVEPLSKDESWQLFHHSMEYSILDSDEVSSVRNLVYDKCEGLPLAITVLANSIRGVVNTPNWREVLESEDLFSTGPTDVICRLKLSYDKLNNILQRCFLCVALYPKDYAINKEDLIHLWMGERLIDDVESVQAQYDMGHSILNKLINSCLLEPCRDKQHVKLHDVVRRMALSISGEKFMVNGRMPSGMEFSKNLHAISTIKSFDSLIQSSTLFKFRNLSILLLQDNPLEVIPESFFDHMRSLRVLNLSRTCIRKLPNSINNLEELQVLDLKSCKKLKQVPLIAKLRKLWYLNLFQTEIERIPYSLERLKNLKELNLSAIPEQTSLPSGVLPALPRLKVLSCHVLGIINELQKLASLESLDAKFENLFDLSSYVRSLHWRTLNCYYLQIGQRIKPKRPPSRGISLQGFTLRGRAEHVVLPFDIQELYLADCSGFRSLSDILNPDNACGFKQRADAFSSLEVCSISRCHDIENLLSPGWMPNLPWLESLEVVECSELKELIVPEIKEHFQEKKLAPIELPRLKQLVLTSLPQLYSIYQGPLVCTSIHTLKIMECLNLKHIPISSMNLGETLVPSSLKWSEGQQKS
ncbi:unnamed protein product [Amaranthus hypochondriacus]